MVTGGGELLCDVLTVEVVRLPTACGRYQRSASLTHNGLPVWVGAYGRRLFGARNGRWYIGNVETMGKDSGWVRSAPHGGASPAVLHGRWEGFQQVGAPWETDPHVRVVAVEGDPEAMLRTPGHHPPSVATPTPVALADPSIPSVPSPHESLLQPVPPAHAAAPADRLEASGDRVSRAACNLRMSLTASTIDSCPESPRRADDSESLPPPPPSHTASDTTNSAEVRALAWCDTAPPQRSGSVFTSGARPAPVLQPDARTQGFEVKFLRAVGELERVRTELAAEQDAHAQTRAALVAVRKEAAAAAEEREAAGAASAALRGEKDTLAEKLTAAIAAQKEWEAQRTQLLVTISRQEQDSHAAGAKLAKLRDTTAADLEECHARMRECMADVEALRRDKEAARLEAGVQRTAHASQQRELAEARAERDALRDDVERLCKHQQQQQQQHERERTAFPPACQHDSVLDAPWGARPAPPPQRDGAPPEALARLREWALDVIA
eukprot:TRINITY_DN8373_c0_g1_i1.p1 TRINITY_DN8373_c0_g1~~TRINITY_DN8373_c0_g1_i1.p1  ORF type:complete len:496 (+),score=96.63 TRINITY_DN8373_c0_g1_i1:77-1564(+)